MSKANHQGSVLDNPFKDWVTLEEAAEIVGHNRSTIQYWASNGKITCYPVGRRVKVVNIEEVKSYAADPDLRKSLRGKTK